VEVDLVEERYLVVLEVLVDLVDHLDQLDRLDLDLLELPLVQVSH